MENRIDLGKYQVRTDLIIEGIDSSLNSSNVVVNNVSDSVSVTVVKVDEGLEKSLKKKRGTYVTIEFVDATNYEDSLEVEKVFVSELAKVIDNFSLNDLDSVLVVGLGNDKSTADSLGPKVVSKVMITRHLFEMRMDVKEGIRPVSGFAPGVMADTGIETCDIVLGVIERVKPSLVIVIDSLASSSISRINRTIQITDTGIAPGSGIGNNRREISFDTIGIPVVAIGIPTVVESSIIVNDAISYLFKHLSYVKSNFDMDKLVFRYNKDYLKEFNDDLSLEDKRVVSGMLGELDDDTKKELIGEVLDSLDYNLIVTPKEIDFLVEKLSKIVATGLDKVLHREV